MKAAEATKPVAKKKSLEKVQTQLSSLRIPIIFGAKSKVFSMQEYTRFNNQIEEIRRMAGGWIRSIRL